MPHLRVRLSRYPNHQTDFNVLGHNLLFCGMVGPASAPPVDEIVVKHQKNNNYNVSYTVKHKGRYLLIVKYGDDQIPGSPFDVNVI